MVANDIFEQINNAVLDLQASQYQTYERPLKTLGRLLHSPELRPFTETLTQGVDLDLFLGQNPGSGGMVGSTRLNWPDDPKQTLGLVLLLIDRFAADPNTMRDFAHLYYYAGSKLIHNIRAVTGQMIIPFVRDYKLYVLTNGQPVPVLIMPQSNKIFIVHGHDGEARESVARYLGMIGFDPIILHEQANRGRTIIEKVEANSDVGFAVVLLTPDDEGNKKGEPAEPRVRQNVLLELGYFIGKLGRDRVCALRRGTVDIPGDFAGVVWTPMDAGNGWKQELARELAAAGYEIEWKKVMR
ncbi:MAG: hypothetical protein AVDCRST_MAG68-991 [uncultured Gemmatimonadetes bacterium]|uniref:CD-NTase-associated protein 12/Pycsar effector protein TIR domain-containing protein n=1 Tax=uncultured Gemmatimonadota bacterium TaxID=203437 RepID=A0A6J4KLH5_9BACT|nr:MAG: hypothetical protein AVDCRST_MAG68-991 [uncultured Gemmatimonadota bacterium]